MVWIFLVLGIALLVIGVLLAVVPMLRADRGHAHAHAHGEDAEEAWDVLNQPLPSKQELIKLPKDEPAWTRLVGSKFLQGSFVGAGTSLVVAGVVLSYALLATGGFSTAGASNSAPKTVDQAAVQPNPAATDPNKAATNAGTTTPVTPKPGGTVAFVIDPGQVSQTIATNLKAQSFITSEEQFLSRLGARGLEMSIQAGKFEIPQGATIDQVIDILTRRA